MKHFLLFVIFISQVASAALYVVKGKHFDMDYEFAMSDEYQDVHGTWGESKYELIWDEYNLVLSGTTAGEPQRFSIDNVLNKVEITTYCGWGDIYYTTRAPFFMQGSICLQKVDKNFTSLPALHNWIVEISVKHLTSDFPEPAQKEVQDFLKTLIKFE